MKAGDGHKADQTRPRRLALEFRAEAIALIGKDAAGVWTDIESVRLDAPEFSDHAKALCQTAKKHSGQAVPKVDLMLPKAQVLSFDAPAEVTGKPALLRSGAIRTVLGGLSPVPASDLCLASHVDGKGTGGVSAVERIVVKEAQIYARKWGFSPRRVTTRYGHEAFANGPTFSIHPPWLRLPVIAGAGAAVGTILALVVGLSLIVGPASEPAEPLLSAAEPVIVEVAPARLTHVDHGAPFVDGAAAMPQPPRVIAAGALRTTAPEYARLISSDTTPERISLSGLRVPQINAASLEAIADYAAFRAETPVAVPAMFAPESITTVGPEAGAQPPIVGDAPDTDSSDAPVSPESESPTEAASSAAADDKQRDDPPKTAEMPDAADPRTQSAAASGTAEPEIDEEDIPGPGSVKTSPVPGGRPDHLDMTPSNLAVASAPRPDPRPKSIKPRPAVIVTSTGEVPKAVRAPERSGPSGPGAANAATLKAAIQLEEMNLLGVFGSKSSRRALLRMPDGEVMRVTKGSVVDGWVVSRIDPTSMRITRGGTAKTLNVAR